MTWGAKYSPLNGGSKYINGPESISQKKELWSQYRSCKQVLIFLPLHPYELWLFSLVSSFIFASQDRKGRAVKNPSLCVGVESLETKSNTDSCNTYAYKSIDAPLTDAKGESIKPCTSGTRRIG